MKVDSTFDRWMRQNAQSIARAAGLVAGARATAQALDRSAQEVAQNRGALDDVAGD
jgi:hypothetical protein